MGQEMYRRELAQQYAEKMGKQGDLHHRMLLDPPMERLLPPPGNLVVLDAGCGNGYWSEKLAEKYRQVVGIDNSTELVEMAQEARSHTNINFIISELGKDLPFRDALFDLVFSHMVLHHVANLDKTAEELNRISKENGTVLLSLTHPTYEIDKRPDLETLTTRTLYTRDAFNKSSQVELYFEPLEKLTEHFETAGLINTHRKNLLITQEYAEAEAQLNAQPKYLTRVGRPRAVILAFQKRLATIS